jgi:hypothetical protein
LRHEQREADPHENDPADDADHGERNAKQPEDERAEDEEEQREQERVEAGLPRDSAMRPIVFAGKQLQVDGQDLERMDDREQGRERPSEESKLASHFRRPGSVALGAFDSKQSVSRTSADTS